MIDAATLLKDLDGALVAAAKVREANPGSAREVLAAVVQIFADFTTATPRWECHSGPLRDLAIALMDLDRGHVAPVLRPKRSGGGAPISADEDAMRARAAYLVEAQIRYAGKTLPVAAKAVADGLTKAGRRKVKRDTVIDWRKDAKNSRSRINEQYRGLIARDDASTWADPKARFAQLMGWLIAAEQRRKNVEPMQKGEQP